MISAEKEKVLFSHPVITNGSIEDWLSAVEAAMRASLNHCLHASLKAFTDMERDEWLFAYPAQCTLVVEQIVWTHNVFAALETIEDGEDRNALREYREFFVEQLNSMIELVRREDLSSLQRATLSAVLVVDIYLREVLENLVAMEIQSVNDFQWTKQLRYYWEESVVVRQTNTTFDYGYEYLGNTPRLVITPLTERCYLTLTSALNLNMGGAPCGPAGTGKTETVKDLAKALGRLCIVFNCSDGLDFKMMGRFFSGLAQAGAWSCFDEFNRIDVEVLSVIAQQVFTIQQALTLELESFVFEGREISLNPNYGCFITMNPGYAGRSELPDNLQRLFRPIAMMVPDYALIAEIVLFSEGFSDAKELANKMVHLYRLASEQLSKQDHYDFGLRALKSGK